MNKIETTYDTLSYFARLKIDRTLILVNPDDSKNRGVTLWLVVLNDSKFLAYADHIETAFDTVADFCDEYCSDDIFSDVEREEAFKEALSEGMSEEQAWEASDVDLMYVGGNGHCVNSAYTTAYEINRDMLTRLLSY